MAKLEFQVMGLPPSRQSKRHNSQKRSSFVIGALIAGVIVAGTHSRGPFPPVTIIPDKPEFGNQMVGVPSRLQSLVIQNSGTDTLQLFSISAQTTEGNSSADFVISPGNCVGVRIEPGASCQIGIGFSPKGVGLRPAKLVLTDNVAGSPHSFPLVGSGLLPPHADARPKPPEVDFGTVAVEGTYDSSLTVLNEGDAPLNIEDIHFDGDSGPFSVVPQTCDRATVQARASCQMTITFSPRQPGTYSASVSIAHGDAWPLTVPIHGVASGPRHGFCCIDGKIDKDDEANCAAHGGIFSQDLGELRNGCQPRKRQLAAPVPLRPGTASSEQAENLYPCNAVQLLWRPVDVPGETISYTVSLNAFSSLLARAGQDPWQPFRGFSPTPATQLTLSNLLPSSNLPRTPLMRRMAAMQRIVQPPQVFRWQVVASDSVGNVSPPSDWRYFRCEMVIP